MANTLDYRTPRPADSWRPPTVSADAVITAFVFVLFGGPALLCLYVAFARG